MSHTVELIRQVIRKQGLHTIYPGQEESAFGDLLQTAWVQIERTLYKYRSRPYCRLCYNPDRPSESLLYDPGDYEYGIKTFEEVIEMHNGKCPKCNGTLVAHPIIPPEQGRFGGSEAILYRGISKVFNMWCVSPDTMLLGNEGFTTINDFVADELPYVYGADGFKPVNGYLEKPLQEAIQLTTVLGYTITTSPEHRLMVQNNDCDWKRVGKMVVGDLLAIQYDQQVFFNQDGVNIKLDKRGDWNIDSINEELGYIIGLFITEGSYSHNKLVIYNVEDEIVNLLENNTLGLRFINEPEFQRVSLCNVRFIEFLQKLGFGERTCAETKFIPKLLLKTSKPVLSAILRGMFDGHGHSKKSDGSVGYTSTSKVLIDQLRVILLNYGMLSKLSVIPERDRESYQLLLSSESSQRFYNDIGFGLTRKKVNISSLPDDLEDSGRLYGVSKKFRKLHRKYGPGILGYDYIRCVLKGSYCKLSTAKNRLLSWQEYQDDEDYKFIQDRIDERHEVVNKIMWLPIKKIEKTETELREISVDSEDHSYIANGFISHNSQISRTVILAYIKKEGRDRRNSNTYKNYLGNKQRPISDMMVRFLQEARDLSKYNSDHMKIIDAIEHLMQVDDRPHDGIIGKLVHETKLSRSIITSFMRIIKLRSFEFTDSPISRNSESCERTKSGKNRIESEDE